ncbi:MAG: hypothetical protein QOE68_894, partial [Thermoanaerobaculia bacterium]|nr:hypothetical protein [Thermoanaerobaculia bacterium]
MERPAPNLIRNFRPFRWRGAVYPVLLFFTGIFTVLHDYKGRFPFTTPATVGQPCSQNVLASSELERPRQDTTARTFWEDSVTHPIFALLLTLGLIHALEVSQGVTLSLLRNVRRQVVRIVANGEKHNQEFEKIFRSAFSRQP